MELVVLALAIIGVSASGALSPGILSASAIVLGVRSSWRSGLGVALGHTIVELPYIVLLSLFLESMSVFLEKYYVKVFLSLAVMVTAFFFAYLLVRDVLTRHRGEVSENTSLKGIFRRGSSIIVGAMFTALNPYFLIWWATLGLELIRKSISLLGLVLGILFLYPLHVWLDYIWLVFLAYAGSQGARIMGSKGYKALLLILALMLVLFALNIVLSVLLGFKLVPL